MTEAVERVNVFVNRLPAGRVSVIDRLKPAHEAVVSEATSAGSGPAATRSARDSVSAASCCGTWCTQTIVVAMSAWPM